jgi:hypothetical protein
MIRLVTVLGAVIVLAAGYAVGGQAGMFALVALAAVVAVLAARLRIPPSRPPPAARREAPPREPGFRGYRRIENALAEARVSRRHFDLVTRPLLQRLLAALFADRRRADVTKDIHAAREVVGEDLWPLLDPARPATADSSERGVGAETMARVVDRMEEL